VLIAKILKAIQADGVFLDTMLAAPAPLRQIVDGYRKGVAFEPEGHPSVEEIERCNASWAQGLPAYPEIGVLNLKWIEPRHMQHQIRRWDRSHREELAAAWLNASGMLVWENIFGTWNPWNTSDRATLRRMAPVWRFFAGLFSQGTWLPYFPTLTQGVFSSCWQGDGMRVWTLVNRTGKPLREPILEVEDKGEEFFDLWHGNPLQPRRAKDRVRLTVPLDEFGGIAALRPEKIAPAFRSFLKRQHQETLRPMPSNDPHRKTLPVVMPKPPPSLKQPRRRLSEKEDAKVQKRPPEPDTPFPSPAGTPGEGGQGVRFAMLPIKGGSFVFTLRHMRRECGCYPDPQTPPERWDQFLRGYPFDEILEHHLTVSLSDFHIDARPVTNGEFERFLQATGYRPAFPENFLKHWGGRRCPPGLRGRPVVYVDVEDARAYAAWTGRRLPTEWEWHRAAVQMGSAFERGRVWEWTESERDDGHTRFLMLRGGSSFRAEGSIWYFPGGPQPIETHAKFIRLYPGLDRCSTIGFRCVMSGK